MFNNHKSIKKYIPKTRRRKNINSRNVGNVCFFFKIIKEKFRAFFFLFD